MDSRIIDLSKYRFEKGLEDFDTAKSNIEVGKYRQAVNRSYYAVFHAMRAVTALDEFDSSKHSGIKAYFNHNYVKEGLFDKSISKMIESLYVMRENADYQDFFVVTKSQAEEQIEIAEKVIDMIKIHLEQRWSQ